MSTVEMIHKLWGIVEKAAHARSTDKELVRFFEFVDTHLLYVRARQYSDAGMYDRAITEVNQMDDMINLLIARMSDDIANAFPHNYIQAYDALEDVLEAYMLQDCGANQWMCAQLNTAYLK